MAGDCGCHVDEENETIFYMCVEHFAWFERVVNG